MKNKKTINKTEHRNDDMSEFIEKLPVRTDVIVLPADEPKQMKLGWTVVERNGGEIWLSDDETQSRLKYLADISVGSNVDVPTLFGRYAMIVTKLNGNEGYVESDGTIAKLEYGTDDRQCWTSSISINKKVLNKLNINK